MNRDGRIVAGAGRLRAWCGAGLLAFGLLAGCMTTPPEVAPPPGAQTIPAPAVRVGEFWEYAVRDAYTGLPRGLYRYTVSNVGADHYTVEVTHDGQHLDTHIYAPGWNGLEHPLTNLQRFRFAPAYPAFEFPLYPGKTWRRIVQSTDAETGRTYNTHVHANVGGWHRIRVPAGEFDALQIVRYVYAGNMESFRLQEEIVEVDWYAPALGYVVVREGRSSYLDTSRSGGKHRPLRVRADWLIGELVQHAPQ